MKAISLNKIHSLAFHSEYYEFENEVHRILKGTLETEAKEEMFLCDADEIIKALTFAYNKFSTGKNLTEIINDWKDEN